MPTTTASDIIRSALLLNGAVAADQTLSASDAADGLVALNDMLESWGLDDTLIYTVSPVTANTTTGADTIALGTRPIRILSAQIRDAANIDHMIIPIGYEDFMLINNKSVQSYYPEVLYCDYAFPTSSIRLWPTPAAAYTITLTCHLPFSGFASLTTPVEFPPGYTRALRYNLAIELAQYGAALPPRVADIAREALLNVRVQNQRISTLQNDPTILGRGGKVNVYANKF